MTPRRSHRRHWSELGERGVYLGMWLMFAAYRLCGRRGFAVLLYPVVFYFFLFGISARRASRAFLARVHAHAKPSPFGDRAPGWRQSFRHFLSFGDAILDKLAAWTDRIRPDQIVYENREAFEALVESGRGGLLIVSHLGNSEVSRAICSLGRKVRIVVLVHTAHSGNFNRLMRSANAATTVSLIQTTEIGPDTAIRLQECIAHGDFVVIAGDRTPVMQSHRVSWAPFLGRPAPFPQGPFILAALLGCPVQLLFCLKERGRYRMVFEGFSEHVSAPRRERGKALDGYVARYAARLEHHAARHPYQWFNFFDFWNQGVTMAPVNAPLPGNGGNVTATSPGWHESPCQR